MRNGNSGSSNGSSDAPLIHLDGIGKTYGKGKIRVEALKDVDLTIRDNEYIAIVGPSGSGKSTLMNILGFLDTPSDGAYRLRGEEVSGFSGDRLAEIRNRHIGFVFQNFHLLPQITAYDNVEMPLLFKGTPARRRRERVEELFESVGLAERMHHKPTELSGGQMQRVAIARALACEPDVILADEPTGNLDSSAGGDIVELFQKLWEKGHTLVLITHDNAIARRTERTIRIQDGRITEDTGAAEPAS
jgi:putative ABC transport system ATP-binding protein